MGEKENKDLEFRDMAEIYSQERSSNSIVRLPDSFYERAVSFIKTRIAQMENARLEGDHLLDRESVRNAGEFQRAREVLESIYNTRERKVVLAALNASRGLDQRTDNMTEEEKDLFFTLKVELETKRDRTIRYDRLLAKPAVTRPETGIDTSTDDFVDVEGRKAGRVGAAARKVALKLPEDPSCEVPRNRGALAGKTGEGQEAPEGRRCLEGYLVVKALADFGPFATPDGTAVMLSRNDIATLPTEIASMLAQEGMVSLVEEYT